MNISTISRRPGRAALLSAATLAAVVSVPAFASPAFAHDAPLGTVPENGVTLTELPPTFSVTMSNPIAVTPGQEGNFGMRITDAAGLYYGDGCLMFDGSTMMTAAELGEPGTYSIVWQLVSSDGHPTSNDGSNPVSFDWQPAVEIEPAVGSPTPPVCGVAGDTPEPEMTANAVPPADGGDADEDAGSQEPGDIADTSEATPLLWIGGGVLVVLLGVGAALLISRRAKD